MATQLSIEETVTMVEVVASQTNEIAAVVPLIEKKGVF